MDKYIACCLTTIFLVFFLVQFATQMENHLTIYRCEAAVEVAKEEAKREGYFTTEIKDELMANFASLGVDTSKVVLDVTETPKYRRNTAADTEFIEYKIGIPIDSIIKANNFFGVSDTDNHYIHYFYGEVPSEKVVR